MPKPIRAFIAVRVPVPRALASVISTLDAMGGPIKAVSDDCLHVTLKFLGDTDPCLVVEINRAMTEIAGRHAALEVRIVGLGAFPTPQRPSVVWAGLQGADTLVAMAEELEASLETFGFAREQRPFHPHLTLARVRAKPPGDLAQILTLQASREFGVAKIETLELIQSELGGRGPRYTTLASAKLAAL